MISYFAVLPILNAVLCIGLAIFMLSRNLRHPANIGFAIGMASLAVIEAGSAILLFSSNERSTALLGMQINLIGQASLPVGWLVFSIAFARLNYKDLLVKWAPLIIFEGIASFVFILLAASHKFISISASEIETNIFTLGPVGRYFYIYLLLGLVVNLIHLENTLRFSTGPKRWQIKNVILGIGAMLAFFIYIASQKLLFSAINIELILLTSSVIFISASVTAVFIVGHKLMDVNIYISRYVIYNSLTILIVGSYLFLIGVAAEGIKYFDVPLNYFSTTLFIFISALLLAILLSSASLRRRVQLYIIRHFYRQKFEFRDKWMETIEKISTKRAEDEIIKTLTEMLSETMGAKAIHIYLYDNTSKNYLLTDEAVAEDYRRLTQSHPLIQHIKDNLGAFLINDIKQNNSSAKLHEDMDSLAAATGAVLCCPLIVDDEMIGFILQDKDVSEVPYGQDDFQILKAISTQAAVQIKNIRLVNDLMSAKEIETFGKMSSFIMHDLKNLTNSLSLVSQNAKHNINNPEFQQDAIKTIDSTVNKMKGLIEKLSTVHRGLVIKKERVDIMSLIDNAIKKAALIKKKDVAIINDVGSLPQISVDSEAIEMVFLNILLNAYEAVKKNGRINVSALLSDGNLCVTVSDNGIGMSKEFIERRLFKPFKTTKKSGLGIGLFQCKAVVEAHGGSIEVESEEGKGTVFRVRLPIE